jgi:predicted nucleic acid-binding protein
MPTLIDTNIVVYAAGAEGDRRHQETAIRALEKHRTNGALAVQGLAEFANVLLRKHKAVAAIRNDVTVLAETWRVLAPDASTVPLALTAVEEHHLSFWDAMLWATAKQHGLTTILSEDGSTGSTVGDILYRSPF